MTADKASIYREIVCNPWSWFYHAEMLYENARGLHGLYCLARLRSIAAINSVVGLNLNPVPSILEKSFKDCPNQAFYQAYCQTYYQFHVPSVGKIIPAYLMLMGMAFENLIKGIHVGRMVKSGYSKDVCNLKELGINKHNSPELAANLKIDLSASDLEILKDANEHLVWAGRYAIPASEKRSILLGSIMNSTSVEADEILCDIFDLYKRLRGIFQSENGGDRHDYNLCTKNNWINK